MGRAPGQSQPLFVVLPTLTAVGLTEPFPGLCTTKPGTIQTAVSSICGYALRIRVEWVPNCPAIAAVTRTWDSFDLEKHANRHGLPATVVRSTEEFLALEQFRYLAALPLASIEKIGDTCPVPFAPNPESPLDGVRACLGHVIAGAGAGAGAGLGRALAYHGADVLNVWRPMDYEIDTVYYTSSSGMRSTTIDFAQSD